MPCHQRRNSPLIIPRPNSWLRFLHETDKTEETAFIRSREALQLLDRVLLNYTACVQSHSRRYLIRASDYVL